MYQARRREDNIDETLNFFTWKSSHKLSAFNRQIYCTDLKFFIPDWPKNIEMAQWTLNEYCISYEVENRTESKSHKMNNTVKFINVL